MLKEFYRTWELSERDFCDYVKETWGGRLEKWAVAFLEEAAGIPRGVLQTTNGMLEAFHGVLKTWDLLDKCALVRLCFG